MARRNFYVFPEDMELTKEMIVEHVLTKTAISEQSKRVYSALERGQALREVAEAFGLSYAAVKQIKSRLDRAIAAVEKLTCH